MKLRMIVTIYLQKNNKILMLKRSEKKKLAPGLWAGLGGHVEPDEINSPIKTCIRELHEETGLAENDITDLSLKCLVTRIEEKTEIRQQYVYFAETDCDPKFWEFNEGTLHWVETSEIESLKMPMTTRHTLSAYLKNEFEEGIIYSGTATYRDGREKIHWEKLMDFDMMTYKGATTMN